MPDARLTPLKGLGPVLAAGIGAWSFLDPPVGGWVFVMAEIAFLAWLSRTMGAANAAALAREPVEPDEEELLRRYALYFVKPELAKECASILAALGLLSLVLVPWLTFKAQWLQAIAIGISLFTVGRLTKRLSPVYALRLAAAKGDRDALRLLAAHDGAARKVSGAERVEQPGAGGEGRR